MVFPNFVLHYEQNVWGTISKYKPRGRLTEKVLTWREIGVSCAFCPLGTATFVSTAKWRPGPMEWSDLTPMDFFFFVGILWSTVSTSSPPSPPPITTLHELNTRIGQASTKNDHEILRTRGRWLNIGLILLEAWRHSHWSSLTSNYCS